LQRRTVVDSCRRCAIESAPCIQPALVADIDAAENGPALQECRAVAALRNLMLAAPQLFFRGVDAGVEISEGRGRLCRKDPHERRNQT